MDSLSDQWSTGEEVFNTIESMGKGGCTKVEVGIYAGCGPLHSIQETLIVEEKPWN